MITKINALRTFFRRIRDVSVYVFMESGDEHQHCSVVNNTLRVYPDTSPSDSMYKSYPDLYILRYIVGQWKGKKVIAYVVSFRVDYNPNEYLKDFLAESGLNE